MIEYLVIRRGYGIFIFSDSSIYNNYYFSSIGENKTDDIDIDDRDRYGDVSR
jgi:hypothetical protein